MGALLEGLPRSRDLLSTTPNKVAKCCVYVWVQSIHRFTHLCSCTDVQIKDLKLYVTKPHKTNVLLQIVFPLFRGLKVLQYRAPEKIKFFKERKKNMLLTRLERPCLSMHAQGQGSSEGLRVCPRFFIRNLLNWPATVPQCIRWTLQSVNITEMVQVHCGKDFSCQCAEKKEKKI